MVEGLDSLSKQTVLRLLRYLFGDKTNEAYYQSNLNNKRLCTDAYFYKYYIQAVPSNLIADTELDVVAQSQATMSVDELTTWIKAKCEKYDYGEIERSLVYLLYHCEKGHDQQVAASVVAKSLSSFFIKNSPIVKRYQMETSAFVAIQVLGEYLFIKDRDYSGFKIGNEALLNSTLTEIFSSADMNYAMNLLYYIYDYIAGSVKHISSSLAMLIDKFMSSTFEEQYSFSKDLLSRFFSCWKVVNLDSFVNYANEIFTNKDFPYVKVIDKFIDNKNEKSSGQDVNVFMDIFGPAKESIVCRMSEDPGAHSTQRLLTYFNELNRN